MRIGVDLGGTKIEAIALDKNGHCRQRQRVATPAGDYPAIIQTITALVVAMRTGNDRDVSVGIATPGSPSPTTGLLRNSNSTCLNGRPLQRDLESALGQPVRLANDADCFTLSEATDGAAQGSRCVFGVIIGTGTGGGIVVDNRLLAGPNAIAGEWGHNPLPWPQDSERPGPACYCGKHGCIETFLSGPGLSADHYRHTGEQLTSTTISQQSHSGPAADTLARYEDRLARSLASIINVIDPDTIVLGGGVSNISRLYDNVPRLWGQYVFSDVVSTRLVRAEHGDSSGVRGAAWL